LSLPKSDSAIMDEVRRGQRAHGLRISANSPGCGEPITSTFEAPRVRLPEGCPFTERF
jgi:hypothetical protein